MGRKAILMAGTAARDFVSRLSRDRAGNTLPMIAAAVAPLLALVGGGIDMGRSYLAETRLQQACDAGVLAARKKLGTQIVLDGEVPDAVAEKGNRMFGVNFRDGAYGTAPHPSFTMALEQDYSISGVATVDVPTTIMRVFGYTNVPVRVDCEAALNFSDTDIMMVLDTTASMLDKADEDDEFNKIDSLRLVVKEFATQLNDSKAPGVRVRFGFVPYANNVNVGGQLKSDWMVDNALYSGRASIDTGTTRFVSNAYSKRENSGTADYPSSYISDSCPDDDYSTEPDSGIDADGNSWSSTLYNGTNYSCSMGSDNKVIVSSVVYTDFFEKYTYYAATKTEEVPVFTWHYQDINVDVSDLKGASGDDPLVPQWFTIPDKMGGYPEAPTDYWAGYEGCIEERATYEIDDYNDVNLSQALDLNIDLVPTNDDATKWRPQLNGMAFVRGIDWNGDGTFIPGEVDYAWDYLNSSWADLATCPSPAMPLAEMTTPEVGTYIDSLVASGDTYHDIGMIWGGRLLSPTGLFSAENANRPDRATSRHMIFLTDGETMPLDVSYTSYGIEPIHTRRWNPETPAGGLTLPEVIEKRFAFACEEVKRKNITVWVISFGISMNPMLEKCAGDGHAFEASDAAKLSSAFSTIATKMGDLRISK